MTNLFDKAWLRDLRRNGASSLTEPEPETTKEAVERILTEFARGCSESGKNPANCGACFDGAVSAIMSFAAGKQEEAERYLREACERLADIIESDDGEAWFEGEKFLKRHAPDIYNVMGVSLSDLEPVPDFPEPTLIDRACGYIVGLLIRKPRR